MSSLTHTHSLSLILTLSDTHTPHTNIYTQSHYLYLTHSLSLCNSHSDTHTHILSDTHFYTHAHTLSFSLSLTHTFTHTHTQSLSLSFSLWNTLLHTHNTYTIAAFPLNSGKTFFAFESLLRRERKTLLSHHMDDYYDREKVKKEISWYNNHFSLINEWNNAAFQHFFSALMIWKLIFCSVKLKCHAVNLWIASYLQRHFRS